LLEAQLANNPNSNSQDILAFGISFHQDSFCQNLINLAVNNNCINIINILFSETDRFTDKYINQDNIVGITKLAISANNLHLLDAILTKHPDILSMVTNENTSHLLHSAVKANNTYMVYSLIDAKDDLNKLDYTGENALHIAIEQSNCNLVEMLIHAGADLNKPNSANISPLQLAMNHGNDTVVKILIGYGANIEPSLLHYVTEQNNQEIAELMITAYASHNSNNDFYSNLLLAAATNNNHHLVTLLLQYNANPYQLNLNQQSILHIAAQKNNLDMMTTCLKYNYNLNQYDIFKHTPLSIAIVNSSLRIITMLLNAGANPFTIHNNKQNLLHIAIMHSNIPAAHMMINLGITLNQCDNNGNEPINLAIIYNKFDMLRIFIDIQKKLNLINIFQLNNLLVTAIKLNTYNLNIINLLLISGANLTGHYASIDPLTVAVTHNNTLAAQMFLNKTKSILTYKRSKKLRELLFIASKNRCYDMTQLLICYGAPTPSLQKLININIKSIDIIKLCIESGADIYSHNKNNKNLIEQLLAKKYFWLIKYFITQGKYLLEIKNSLSNYNKKICYYCNQEAYKEIKVEANKYAFKTVLFCFKNKLNNTIPEELIIEINKFHPYLITKQATTLETLTRTPYIQQHRPNS
jgi:ankyrin repeat protein